MFVRVREQLHTELRRTGPPRESPSEEERHRVLADLRRCSSSRAGNCFTGCVGFSSELSLSDISFIHLTPDSPSHRASLSSLLL